MRITTFGLCLLAAPVDTQGQNLAFRDVDTSFVVMNRYYTASVSKQTGELQSVIDRRDGHTTISGDRLIVRISRPPEQRSADFSSWRLSIQDEFDFYVRVVVASSNAGNNLRVERTYEFTNSPYIYEEVAIVGTARPGARDTAVTLNEVTWEFQRSDTGVSISRTTDNLWTEFPHGLLGGLELALPGHAFDTGFDNNPTHPRRRMVVSGHVLDRVSTSADLHAGRGLVAATVVSVLGSLPDSLMFRPAQFWFYPGYGLRQQVSESTLTFINWNQYEVANRLIPLRRKYVLNPTLIDWIREDMLIRIAMHLVDRMKLDGGWPRWPSWRGSVTYPEGDIFTAHSRAFPVMVYVWSYLTIEWERGRWTHFERDGDLIYNQLQKLRRFYGLESDTTTLNFKDQHEGVSYIAYSASRKEVLGNGPKGVLNAHAQALDFVWIMNEASQLRGSTEDANRWQAIGEFYHPGTSRLYEWLYPGARDCHSVSKPDGPRKPDCDFLSGHVAYSIDNPCIYPGCSEPGAHPSYSFISHEGIAAGYLAAGDYEPEFVDAVERASRLNYNPYGPLSPVPLGSLVTRLGRVLPVALAFTGDTFGMAIPETGSQSAEQMQYDISAASLKEVATFARLRFQDQMNTRRAHDPGRAIGEWSDHGLRKVIWSNKPFVTEWVKGFWEEMKPEEIPPNLVYSVGVTRSGGGQLGNWVAYRMGNRIEVMADFDGGIAVVKLPAASRVTQYLTGYRDYDPNTLRWKDAVNETWRQVPSGGMLALPNLVRKRLVFAYLRER